MILMAKFIKDEDMVKYYRLCMAILQQINLT